MMVSLLNWSIGVKEHTSKCNVESISTFISILGFRVPMPFKVPVPFVADGSTTLELFWQIPNR